MFSIDLLRKAYYLICACVVVLITKYILVKLDRNKFMQEGFPGLKLAWYNIVGHAAIVLSGSEYGHLYPMHTYFLNALEGYRQLFSSDNMFCIWALHRCYFVLYKADSVEELLKNSANLEKAVDYSKLHDWIGTGLLTSKGRKWKSRRKILTPSFHFDILKDFLPVLEEKSKILVEILTEATNQEWIDICEPIKLCSLDIICETTLGVNINAQLNKDSEYVQAVHRVSTITMDRVFNPKMMIDFIFNLRKVGKQYKKDLEVIHGFTRKIIQEKKEQLKMKADLNQNDQSKRKALMDLLLYHHIAYQDFTEEDICEEVDTFAFEGHDTVSSALSWSIYLIGLYPEVQKKIHDELDNIFEDDNRPITTDDLRDMRYLECVIKEVQRLYPPVPFIGRQITSDCTICRRSLKSGSECILFIYGLHRDQDVFSNPEWFDPERFLPENATGRNPYAYVPFSAGPRNCIGQRFAMMELKVVLASVLRWFSVLSLEQRDKLLPAATLILRPSHPIKTKITLRHKKKEEQ